MTGSHPAPGPADSDAALSSALDEMAAATDRLLAVRRRHVRRGRRGPVADARLDPRTRADAPRPQRRRGHQPGAGRPDRRRPADVPRRRRGAGGGHPGRGRPPPRRPAAGPGRVGRAAAGGVRRRVPRGGQVAGGRDAARRDGVRLGDPADPGPGGRDPPRRPGRGLHAGRTGAPPSRPAPWTSWRRSSAPPATVRSGCWWPPTPTPGGRWPPTGPELAGPVTELAAWLVGRSPGDGLAVQPAGAVPPAPRGSDGGPGSAARTAAPRAVAARTPW